MPDFPSWQRENVDRFAAECYQRLQELTEANEQLRLDNKLLHIELRKHVDDWK